MPLRTIAILLLIISLAIGCDRSSDPAEPAVSREQSPVRIVSLSPAISRTLVDFGLGHRVVGRTQWCTSIDDAVPVVGDLLHVDYERLVRLDPTHILIQPRAVGPDLRLIELAEEDGWTIGQWILNDREDIETFIHELSEVLYAMDDPRRASAAARARDLIEQINDALRTAGSAAWRGRVLLIDSVDPVMVFGHETYLHDIITELGAENASQVEGWKELSLEDLTRLDPEAIIIVAPGADARQGTSGAVVALRRLDVAAVRSGRIAILNHPDALLPSSAIIEVIRDLREILRSFEALGNRDEGGPPLPAGFGASSSS